MPPSAIGGHAVFAAGGGGFQHRGELRHADAGDHAGGADAARPDADLHRVGAGLDQRQRALRRGDVAGDDLHGVGLLLDRRPPRRSTPCEWPCAVSTTMMSTSAAISARARMRAVRADTGRGGDAQAAEFVLVGERVGLRLVHVLHGDQPDAAITRRRPPAASRSGVDAAGARACSGADVGGDGDQVLPRHQLIDLEVRVGGEAHVAVGDDADQAVGAALDHRDAADAVRRHQGFHVGQGLVGMDGERVHHHAAIRISSPAGPGRPAAPA